MKRLSEVFSIVLITCIMCSCSGSKPLTKFLFSTHTPASSTDSKTICFTENLDEAFMMAKLKIDSGSGSIRIIEGKNGSVVWAGDYQSDERLELSFDVVMKNISSDNDYKVVFSTENSCNASLEIFADRKSSIYVK